MKKDASGNGGIFFYEFDKAMDFPLTEMEKSGMIRTQTS